jgi:rare lipoprotein A
MYDLTAAHPTLPLGSWVRVTNLNNGRAVVVRINDRGPVVPGRIIDLSYNTARVLHFQSQGLQRVRLDVVKSKSNSQTQPAVLAALRY